jgi:hypothetical protein
MAERLPPLPQMQAKIDALLDAYGEDAVPMYSTDGTSCAILSGPAGNDDTVYLAIVQIDLDTMAVHTSQIMAERGDIGTIIV